MKSTSDYTDIKPPIMSERDAANWLIKNTNL